MDAVLELEAQEADWTLIRTFVEVVRAGTLSEAARRLNATQPTVGRQIRRLEQLCGEPLFLRTGRELIPTERARTLHEQASELETEVTALARAFTPLSGDGPGVVRITTSEMFAAWGLADLLPPLLEADPGLEIEVMASDRIDNLMRRDADIAVRFGRPVQPDLIATKVGDLHIGLFASRALAAGRPIPSSHRELDGWPWVGSRSGSEILAGAQALGVVIDPHLIRVRSDSLPMRLAAIRAGMGIGPLPLAAAKMVPELVRIAPELVAHSLPIWLVAHDDLNRNRRMRAVFDHLQTILREMFARGAHA